MVNKGITKKAKKEVSYSNYLCEGLTKLTRMQGYRYIIKPSYAGVSYDVRLESEEDPSEYIVLLANIPAYVLPKITLFLFKFAVIEGFFINDRKEANSDANSKG